MGNRRRERASAVGKAGIQRPSGNLLQLAGAGCEDLDVTIDWVGVLQRLSEMEVPAEDHWAQRAGACSGFPEEIKAGLQQVATTVCKTGRAVKSESIDGAWTEPAGHEILIL